VSLRGIVLLLVFIPSVPMSFIRPFYGIIVWIIIAFLNPQQFTWGAANIVPWAFAIAIPTLLGFVLFNKDWSSVASRESLLILLLWIWFTITSIVSSNTPLFMHHTADTWAKWELVSKVFLITLVMPGIVNTFARLRITVIVIAVCFGLFVLKALPFLIATGGAARVYGPEKSMLGDNNDFGLALNMTLPFFYFLAQTETQVRVKRLFAGLFVGTIPAIFFTYSRGALIGLIVVCGCLLARSKQRLLLIPVIIAAAGLMVLFAPQSWKERMNPTREGAMDNSALSRINSWTFSWNLASEFPITGGGFSTFTQPLFDRYAPNALDLRGPHSVYFGLLAEHGFPGLILYLIMVVSCFLSAASVIKWARFHGDEVIVGYANMFRFGMVGFLTSGIFLGRAYFDYFFTIVSCIIILKRVCFIRWAEAEAEHPDEEEDEMEAAPEPGYGLAGGQAGY
jgi:probable O-glycosylation ligase (exosortase A-associated)